MRNTFTHEHGSGATVRPQQQPQHSCSGAQVTSGGALTIAETVTNDKQYETEYRCPTQLTVSHHRILEVTESDFPGDLSELSKSEAESSYQELWQEQGVKYKQEESNDLKHLTGELTSDRDSLNAVKGGN